MSLKRAFTKDGRSLKSVKNEYGVIDNAGKVAILIRLAVFIPVVIAVIGLILTQFTDITFEQYIEAILQVIDVLNL